jgi:catechol 2,3-dioxygenase-like lactoylglutathione lyase family enzyme
MSPLRGKSADRKPGADGSGSTGVHEIRLMTTSRETRGLDCGDVATRLPAQDLERARRFYAEKLGLEPLEERPGGLRYRCRSGEFALFESAGAASGDHTQMAWEVDDIEATVDELRERGVVFEEYDLPGLSTVHGIAEVEGNYPSKGGIGERAAWFRDSEGNMLGIGQRLE